METSILLENGTNELEVLEFVVNGNNYGINVAKVREIISYVPVTPVPNAHPAIEGIFMPRDILITAINLERILGVEPTPVSSTDMMIITNFNKLNIAFHVHSVSGIHRVSWADIIKPDATLTNLNTSVATGVVRLAEKLIIILDFEKIVTDISPEIGLKVSEIDKLGERDRNKSPILIAEDSPLLSKLIRDSLIKAGYDNIIATSNGQEAWDKLIKLKKEGNVLESVKCIVTDIEMPRMDGHRLTKLVKTDEVLSNIPLIIFSSLVNDEMRAKGKALGADAQLSKPEIGNLVKIIDDLIDR
ncbi:MAG: chemotaxis protein [Lachnospiraceae bacterium]|nr:chemotaxis protein [Lachnospiraceae bacterium]